MKRAAALLLVLTGLASSVSYAQCRDDDIEAAFRRQDIPALQSDLASRMNKTNLDVVDAELIGLSTYRIATLWSRSGHNDEIKDLLQRTVEKIEPVWSRDKRGDLSAILSTLYGFQIGMSPWLGIRLGQKTQEMLEQAQQGRAASPRMHLAEALSRYYRSELLGGGPAKAAAEFKLSIAGYGTVKPGNDVCWGRTDAMIGLARAKIKLNERAAAIALVEQAVAADPKHPGVLWLMDELHSGKIK